MKWGYGLTIFGVLGFIATMTNKETMNMQNFLVTVFFIILGLFLIIKNNKKNVHDKVNSSSKNNIKIDNTNYKHINNIGSVENVVYPIHIKYKKVEIKKRNYQDEKLNFWYDVLNPTNETAINQPTYNCILNGKIVATLSAGQEMDLDVIPGEYVMFFELANNLPRNKIKNK